MPADPTLFGDKILALLATRSSGYVVLDPQTGQAKFTVGAPVDDSQQLYSVSVAQDVLIDVRYRPPNADIVTSRLYDAAHGRLLLTIPDHPFNQRVLGVSRTIAVSALFDSLIVAHDRTTGREVWRSRIPAFTCTRPCGWPQLVDVIGDEVLLAQLGTETAALIRVTATGIASAVPVSRDVFPSTSQALQFVPRASPAEPLVVASHSSLTSLDPQTGATRYRVLYSTVSPAGFRSAPNKVVLTRDGRWLSLLFGDSTGTAADMVREVVLRTSDGGRVRERSLPDAAESVFTEWPRGACGASQIVRVRKNLSLEYTDMASGRISTSDSIPALAALRPLGGVFNQPRTTFFSSHLVVYNALFQPTVTGVRCAP